MALGEPVQGQVIDSNPQFTVTAKASKSGRNSDSSSKRGGRVCCGCALGCFLCIIIPIISIIVIGVIVATVVGIEYDVDSYYYSYDSYYSYYNWTYGCTDYYKNGIW